MASQTGNKTVDLEQYPVLIDQLLKKPKNFSFIQAMRLLALHYRKDSQTLTDFLQQNIKISPELSLAHPSTDIVSVQEKGNQYQIIATFLSLYGASSPLPTFYTEELLEEARTDESASRDFLDIFNQSLYNVYYLAYNSSKLAWRTLEQHEKTILELQYALLGFGESQLRQDAGTEYEDLACINIFTRYANSAHSLEIYLKMRLKVQVKVEQCVSRVMQIPVWQYSRLGTSTLGNIVIGKTIHDYEGKFKIHLLNLNSLQMASFQPKQPGRELLQKTVHQFLRLPLEYEIVLHSEANALPQASLSGACLGTVFLVATEHPAQATTYYC